MTPRHTAFAATHARLVASGAPGIDQALDDLAAIAPVFRRTVAAMMAARPSACGAASYDGPMVTGGGSSSSTERLALSPSPVAHDIATLDSALLELDLLSHHPGNAGAAGVICRNARTLWRIVSVWTPKAPTDKQRREVEQVNDPTPECHPCRDHADRHEPARTTTDIAGTYDQAVPLCRWHADFAVKAGRPASRDETQRHHVGLRIRIAAV